MNDINNERKKIEEKYKNLSVELETILDIIPGMVFCKDKNDVVTRVNQTFADILKLNKEDIIGKTSFDLFPPEQAEKFRKDDLDVMTSKKPKLNIEESVDFPEGKIFSITNKVPHFNEKGEVIGTIGLAIDITDRKVIEQKLKESEEKYGSVIDALTRIGIGIDIVDLNFNILYQNKVLEDIFGQSEGKLCYNTYLGLDQSCDFCPMIKAVQNNKIESAIIPTSDGKSYEVISAPLQNLDDIIDRAAEIVIDITERKQAEEKLKESEENYKNLYEEAPNAYFSIGVDKSIIRCNKAAERLLGYSREELLEMKVIDLYSDTQNGMVKAKKLFEQFLEGEPIQDEELQMERKDGKQIWISLSVKPKRDIHGYVIESRSMAIDITERKKAEEIILKEKNFSERLINSSVDGIIAYDLECRYTIWNPGMERISSVKKEVCLGKSAFEVFPFLKETGEDKFFYDSLDGKTVIAKDRPYRVPETGTEGFFEGHYSPLFDETEKIIGGIAIIRDITDRKKSEEKIKYQADLVENVSDAIISSDKEFNILSWNKAAELIYGWKAEEAIGKNIMGIIPVTYLYDEEETVLKDFFVKGFWKGEVTQPRKDGTIIYILASVTVIKDITGNPIGAVAINKDITESKKAEMKLKQEREKAELYLNLVNVIIVALDRYGIITLINKKGCEILGYSEEELIGKSWFETCLPPQIRNRSYKYFKKFIDGKIDVLKSYENLIWTKDRNERLIAWSTVLLKDNSGNITGTLGSGEDITKRRRAEEILKESEKKYKLLANEFEMILDNIPGLVFFKDTENNFIRVNKYHADAHKLRKEEMEGVSCFEIYPKEQAQAFWEDDLEVIRSKKPKFNIIEPWDTPEGTRWALTSKIPYFDENGNITGIIGFAADITERKKTEEKLIESEARYRDAYEHAEFYKDLFAHDISNILQNIQASLGLLSMWRNEPEKTEKINEIMNILNDQVIRGSKLVSNIRKLSQISEIENNLESIEIMKILKDAIKYIYKSYPEKDLNIQIESQSEEIFVQANELLLDLFENILINAVKYNINPKTEISIKLSKEIKNGNKIVKIEFIDNGLGIPDAMKERIFGGMAPRKDKVHGMGLGLLLVKRIITNFNGQIWVEDKIKGAPSQGSNFILLIPEVV